MGGWLCFLLGMTAGAMLGVMVMACLQISRLKNERERSLRGEA